MNLYFIFVLLALLTCGLVSSSLAGEKGRDKLGWFLIGFFLGIIGVIIAAVSSPITDSVSENDLKECPFCAEKIKIKATICRFCNSKLDNDTLNQDMNSRTEIEELKKRDEESYKKLFYSLKEEAGDDCLQFAIEQPDKWDCVCGTENTLSLKNCSKCKRNKIFVLDHYSISNYKKRFQNQH